MQVERLSGCRDSTSISRYQAVKRVILAMHKRLDEPLSLQDMAKIAMLSPYHFNRVFHQVTGIPPGQFLGVLRLETAKRLLLTTQLSVIEVCFEVGYNSLGTFTTRFAQLIGVPPLRLRRLAEHFTPSYLESLCDRHIDLVHSDLSGSGFTGQISAPSAFTGLIFVGLFPTPIPQSRPVSCTLLTAPGTYHIGPVPDGCYYVSAAALAWSEDPLTYLLHDMTLRGSVGPIWVRHGQVNDPIDITLRPPQPTDPPILVILPLLLTKYAPMDSMVTA